MSDICIECKYAEKRPAGSTFVTCTLTNNLELKGYTCKHFCSKVVENGNNANMNADLEEMKKRIEQMEDDIRLLKRLVR